MTDMIIHVRAKTPNQCGSCKCLPPVSPVVLLDLTASIVEKNPKKFKMESSELRERKAFVKMTKNSVKVL